MDAGYTFRTLCWIYSYDFSFVCVEALIKNNSTNRRESRNNVENRYDKIFMENNKRELGVAVFNHLVHIGIFNFMSDSAFVKLTYKVHVGKN